MSDAMSFAELDAQHVELLPARTVLSLVHASTDGTGGTAGAAGIAGQPGSHGATGESIHGNTMWALFGYNQAGSITGAGDANGSTTS